MCQHSVPALFQLRKSSNQRAVYIAVHHGETRAHASLSAAVTLQFLNFALHNHVSIEGGKLRRPVNAVRRGNHGDRLHLLNTAV